MGCPGPKEEHRGALWFSAGQRGKLRTLTPVLTKCAKLPGEARDMASSDSLGPKGYSSLLGTGDAQMLCLTCGYVLTCGMCLSPCVCVLPPLPQH